MPWEWERFIDTIRADNTSGAAELARAAALGILDWIDQSGSMPPHTWKEAMTALAPELYMAQPAMAPLFNLVNNILLAQESIAAQDAPQPYVRRTVRTFLEQLTQVRERMTTAALGLLPSGARILTFSYSSTVLAVLLAAHACQRLSAVLCTEGRPMLEGQRLSQELARAGMVVHLGIDAAIATLAEQADMALVGADSVTMGGVVNKLGTTSLALACRHIGIPCFVVADRLKWLPFGAATPVIDHAKPTQEVWPDPPPGVTIWNPYFDCTPMTLFSGIIGENGVQLPEGLWQALRAMPIAQLLRSRTSGVG